MWSAIGHIVSQPLVVNGLLQVVDLLYSNQKLMHKLDIEHCCYKIEHIVAVWVLLKQVLCVCLMGFVTQAV